MHNVRGQYQVCGHRTSRAVVWRGVCHPALLLCSRFWPSTVSLHPQNLACSLFSGEDKTFGSHFPVNAAIPPTKDKQQTRFFSYYGKSSSQLFALSGSFLASPGLSTAQKAHEHKIRETVAQSKNR
eukprot:5828914-Amphidinium_carterae.2